MNDPDDGTDRDAPWTRITHLFHRALEQPAEARAEFVAREAGHDRAIAAEVLSLLAAHARAANFIEAPAADPGDLDLLARTIPVEDRAIGPYRLRRILGEGGMGVVYLAEDTRLGRTVALKAVMPRYAGDAVRAERLRREARAAASLSHPGIATVYALDEIDGQWYLASEYVPGDTLRDELTRGMVGLEGARETGLALARALGAAHARGVVHRDLKPENVVRALDGQVKILDFGLARLAGESPTTPSLTDAGTALGTPAYMSPEQIRGAPVDGRADIFALGIVIHELATGRHPFRVGPAASTIASILEDEPARLVSHAGPSAAADPAAAALDRVVATCLRKSPGERFQSAAEVIDALEQAQRIRRVRRGRQAGQVRQIRELGTRPAQWWWRFHQGATTAAYVLLLGPLWQTRHLSADDWGMLLFMAGLVAVIVAGALRLHLWFAASQYPQDWRAQHVVSRRWIGAADVLFTIVLLVAGIRAVRTEAPAALLVAAAAGVAVSYAIIEPATTRAAFEDT